MIASVRLGIAEASARDEGAAAPPARPVPASCLGTAWTLRPSLAALPLTVSAFAIAWLEQRAGAPPRVPVSTQSGSALRRRRGVLIPVFRTNSL